VGLKAGDNVLHLPLCAFDLNWIDEFFAELETSPGSNGKSVTTAHIRTLSCSLSGGQNAEGQKFVSGMLGGASI
jgi:hypothetical protein